VIPIIEESQTMFIDWTVEGIDRPKPRMVKAVEAIQVMRAEKHVPDDAMRATYPFELLNLWRTDVALDNQTIRENTFSWLIVVLACGVFAVLAAVIAIKFGGAR
jgi:hypothetical protein